MEIALAITTGVCAWNWFIRWCTTQILVMVYKKRGYPKPTDDEIKECLRRIVKNRFKKESLF